jgi:hypothetical protein
MILKRAQVFDLIVLFNTIFVAGGALIVYLWTESSVFNGFIAGGLLGWLNNFAFRTAFRLIASQTWLWKIGVFFFVFLFSVKLLLNFWAVYYLIVEADLPGMAVLSGLVPGILSVIVGSLVYGKRLQAS